MTDPANKRRTHNDKARALGQKPHEGSGARVIDTRRSPYGKRLADMRRAKR